MLGSEVARVCLSHGIPTEKVSRESGHMFDATLGSFAVLAKDLDLSESDYVVNCIGWIPQKSSGDELADSLAANALNNVLMHQISDVQKKTGFRWIQIGTDCVFSPSSAICHEDSPKSARDVYGKSKILGERYISNAIFIRCSIVGPDEKTSAGLFSWFKGLPPGSHVKGFGSVRWNGVSTTAFARLVVGLVASNWKHPIFQHWIPRGSLSKFELLKLFKSGLGRVDVEIEEVRVPASQRILGTNNEIRNAELWKLAGYNEIPSHDELVRECVSADFDRRQSNDF